MNINTMRQERQRLMDEFRLEAICMVSLLRAVRRAAETEWGRN